MDNAVIIREVSVMSIKKAVSRSNVDGMPITEYSLRRLVKSGKIPVRKVGKKTLIYYPNLVRYLTCEDGCDNVAATVIPSGIRRVDL